MKTPKASASDTLHSDMTVQAGGQKAVLGVRDPLHAAAHVVDATSKSLLSPGRNMEWLIYFDRPTLDDEWRISTEGDAPAVFSAQTGEYTQAAKTDYPSWLAALTDKSLAELGQNDDLVATVGVERVRLRIQEMEKIADAPKPDLSKQARRYATGAHSNPLDAAPLLSRVFRTDVGPVLALIKEGPRVIISSLPEYPLVGFDRMGPDLPQLGAIWQNGWLSKPTNPVLAKLADDVIERILVEHKPELDMATQAVAANEARIRADLETVREAFVQTIRDRIMADESLVEQVEARRAPAFSI